MQKPNQLNLFSKITVSRMKDVARENGIRGYSTMNKAQLFDVLSDSGVDFKDLIQSRYVNERNQKYRQSHQGYQEQAMPQQRQRREEPLPEYKDELPEYDDREPLTPPVRKRLNTGTRRKIEYEADKVERKKQAVRRREDEKQYRVQRQQQDKFDRQEESKMREIREKYDRKVPEVNLDEYNLKMDQINQLKSGYMSHYDQESMNQRDEREQRDERREERQEERRNERDEPREENYEEDISDALNRNLRMN